MIEAYIKKWESPPLPPKWAKTADMFMSTRTLVIQVRIHLT